MFELLFNQPLGVWREATLVWASGWSPALLAGLILLGIGVLVASLWRQPLASSRRTIIAVLQGVVLAIVLTMLWRPALIMETTQAGDNSIAWLLDISDSMQTRDTGGRSRDEAMRQAFTDNDWLGNTSFDHRLHALGDGLSRVETLGDLPAPANRTGIARSLDELLATVSETSLAAVVLLSDGSDNVGKVDAAWWRRVASAGVPVHTIGIGSEQQAGDIELTNVEMPSEAMTDSPVSARITLRHGMVGTARLRITAGSELLLAEDIELPPDVATSIREVTFNSGEAGTRELEFQITPPGIDAEEESNRRNNRQPRMLEVRDEPRRVLYVEGEPRWEYKFLRRALDQTAAVEVVSLLRTSPNKFYRQGVRDASELADGFPTTREALFAYDAIIIGSLEAAELNTDQQAAVRDFVAIRGGALLMLSGRHGLADGGWARSAVSAALPVTLSSRLDAGTYERRRDKVRPSRQGQRTDWLLLGDDESASQEAWGGLPEVADRQALGQPKPGALVLLESDMGPGNTAEPMLVWQRYGQGISLVLGTSGTWRWQMSLDSDDQRHERFWQQLLGHMTASSLPRLSISSSVSVARDRDAIEVDVQVFTADFTPLQAGSIQGVVASPDNRERTIELQADPSQPGRYLGTVPLTMDGPYALSVSTPPEGEAPATASISQRHWWVSEAESAERFGVGLQSGFLERLALSTGGQFLTLDRLGELQSLLGQSNAALKREQRLPLWNMPVFFLLLLLAKGLEWALRLLWKRL